jgi:hypothetical protein
MRATPCFIEDLSPGALELTWCPDGLMRVTVAQCCQNLKNPMKTATGTDSGISLPVIAPLATPECARKSPKVVEC